MILRKSLVIEPLAAVEAFPGVKANNAHPLFYCMGASGAHFACPVYSNPVTLLQRVPLCP